MSSQASRIRVALMAVALSGCPQLLACIWGPSHLTVADCFQPGRCGHVDGPHAFDAQNARATTFYNDAWVSPAQTDVLIVLAERPFSCATTLSSAYQTFAQQTPQPTLIQLDLTHVLGTIDLQPGYYALNGGLPDRPREWQPGWAVFVFDITGERQWDVVGTRGEVHIDVIDSDDRVSGTGTFLARTNDDVTSQWTITFDAPFNCE